MAIKINRHDWSVQLAPQFHEMVQGNLGMCHYDKRSIFVSKDIEHKDMLVDTIYHELSHALLEETTFNTQITNTLGDYYENFIDLMGQCLRDLCENGEVDKKIKQMIKGYKNE